MNYVPQSVFLEHYVLEFSDESLLTNLMGHDANDSVFDKTEYAVWVFDNTRWIVKKYEIKVNANFKVFRLKAYDSLLMIVWMVC